MIAIVFDSAGTLVKIIRIIKDLEKDRYLYNKQTVDLVDEKKGRALIIIKDDPLLTVDKENPNELISNFLKKVNIGISYCNPPIIRDNIYKDKKTKVKELQEPLNIIKKYKNIETGYGSALIFSTYEKKVDYTIATGGCLIDGAIETINKLKDLGVKIYIASGDREDMVKKLANKLNVEYIAEANHIDKRNLIKSLKEKGYYTIMVGDGANDILAMEESDLAVATLQNGTVSKKVLLVADKIIFHIKEILNIINDLEFFN